jgi:CRP-like cAMP-binding protein
MAMHHGKTAITIHPETAPGPSKLPEELCSREKCIPDHIVDGSIVIDSIEAFGSILKQFPNNPALLKAYSDFLAKNDLFDLAAKFYHEAAALFIESGKMLQAIVSKKLQWRIQPATAKDVRTFLASIKNGNFPAVPLKVFFDRLSREEIFSVLGSFIRVRLPAGKFVKKKGDKEDNLYFIVSGTLKDSTYPSLEEKAKIYRPSDLYLAENQFFGNTYPFNEEKICTSDIETITQVELIKISRHNMMQLCRKYPAVELGIIDLFKIRVSPDKEGVSKLLRKTVRYHIPIDMTLEIYPEASANTPVLVHGFSSDISVGGVCVILDSNHADMSAIMEAFQKKVNSNKIWMGLPTETMQIKILGSVAWSHKIIFQGKKTLALGIQFEEMSPRLRGMLFMFASCLQQPG